MKLLSMTMILLRISAGLRSIALAFFICLPVTSHAWKSLEQFHDRSYLGEQSLEAKIKYLARDIEEASGIQISYVYGGNKDLAVAENVAIKSFFDYMPLGIVVARDAENYDLKEVIYYQLLEIQRSVSQEPRLISKLRGLEIIVFARSSAQDTASQISMINAYPIWACQESVKAWVSGAKEVVRLGQKAIVSDEVHKAMAKHPVAGIKIAFYGGVLVVMHALRTVSCFPGDIFRDVSLRFGANVDRRGIVFEAPEITATMRAKLSWAIELQ